MGRRGAVCVWLREANAELVPTPLAVLAGLHGLKTLAEHLDRFDE